MKKKISIIFIIGWVFILNVNVFGDTEPVIDYQFAIDERIDGHEFSDDRASVSFSEFPENFGCINKSGEFIIPVNNEYSGLRSYSDGLLIEPESDNKTHIYDKTGKEVFSVNTYDKSGNVIAIREFHDGLALVESRNSNGSEKPIGYIDKTGNLLIDIGNYSYAQHFSEGYAVVGNYEKVPVHGYDYTYTIINKKGDEIFTVSEPGFVDDVKSDYYEYGFSEGLLNVYGGYMDYKGDVVISHGGGDFHEGMALFSVNQGDRYSWKSGFINKKGEEVIPAEYDEVNDFSCSLALVSKDSNYSYIDMQGNKVFSNSFYEKYSEYNTFKENLACVQDKETGLYGYVNTKGEEVIPCEFEDAGDFHDGLAPVVKDNKLGYIKSPYVTSLRINGKHVMTDIDPINMEGKTMVPIEETAKYFGVDTTVDLASNGVYFKKGDIYAENFIGDKKLNTNSKKTELTTPIVVKDGVAYIYIRDLADIFGYSTSYEAGTSTVVLEG